jgi:hypothetical protein
MAQTPLAPRAEIRRFDIFAEWNRLKARHHHDLPEAAAQAYGLAVAKVVAARKFAGYHSAQVNEWKRRARREDLGRSLVGAFRLGGGVCQQDRGADGQDVLSAGLSAGAAAGLERRQEV